MNINNAFRLVCYSLMPLFLLSCVNEAVSIKNFLREGDANLDREYASYRSKHIKNVVYDISIDIADNPNHFIGSNFITFTLTTVPENGLTIDTANKIDQMVCNESQWEFSQHAGYVDIPVGCLKQGENKISFKYKGEYSTSGYGVLRYTDSETGNSYVYSRFTPNYASSLTPIFDQPDIKARFKLSVIAPHEWIVISAMPEINLIPDNDNKSKKWDFEKTQPIPSYAFSFAAGLFQIVEDKSYRFPMRIIARPEILEGVNSENLLKMTRQSFDFYEDYFKSKYPFPKYDQILIPAYPDAAMENVGATVLNESMVINAPNSYIGAFELNDIISHEIAHMWVGNLITLKWWDDLWLSEGLAEYMSNLQRAHNSDFKDNTWNIFYARRIQWASSLDQSENSHAIKLNIDKVNDIKSKYDGVTYAKSAAILRQLSIKVGEDNLQKGIRNYINNNSWANASTNDFFEEIEEAFGADLTLWFDEWINTKGLNEIEVSFICKEKNNLTKELELKEIYAKQRNIGLSRVLRKHSLNAGLYYMENGKLNLKTTKKLNFEGESKTFNRLHDIQCPDFIYPNHDDTGYVKVSFNSKDMGFISSNIGQFEYPLRDRLWDILWEKVESGALPLPRYIDAVSNNLELEHEAPSKTKLLSNLTNAYRYLSIMPDNNEVNQLKTKISGIIKKQFFSAKTPKFQSIIFRNYILVASQQDDLIDLKNILLKNHLPKNQPLDQPARWLILRQLAPTGVIDIDNAAREEIKRDSSPMAKQFFISVDAATKNLQIKKKWLAIASQEHSDYSLTDLKMLSKSLFPPNQMDIYRNTTGELYQIIERASENRKTNTERLNLIAQFLMPACTKKEIQSLIYLKKKIPPHASSVKDIISGTIKMSNTCMKISNAL